MATGKPPPKKPPPKKPPPKKPPPKKPVERKVSLGVQIDAIFRLREKLREIQALEAAQKDLIAAAEIVLMETMEKEGVEKSTGSLASVSISSAVSANVVDWDEFYKYIYKNKAAYLLHRRVSVDAIRELFLSKGKVPGVEPFEKKTLYIRKT